jgi:L-threonylcarbamoyladenylate synthase
VLLPKDELLSDIVTAGLGTVGVRFPSHPVAIKLIQECGFPLAAPSANLSGRPSPTIALHVLHDLDGRIPLIIDGGASSVGLESTVLDATVEPPIILRPGAITAKMLRPYLPDIQVYGETTERNKALEERPPTPGMKYKHYSPTATVVLFARGPYQERNIQAFVEQHKDSNLVRLCIAEDPSESYRKIFLSRTGNLQEIASSLFAGLREADLLTPDFILAQEIDEEDEGLAIMNRLSKAASEVI